MEGGGGGWSRMGQSEGKKEGRKEGRKKWKGSIRWTGKIDR